MSILFCSLLFIAPGKLNAVNLKILSPNRQIEIYLRNALMLADNLRRVNLSFALFTNQAELIQGLLAHWGLSGTLEVREISFETPIPEKVRFYAAHHRLDLFPALGQLPNDYVVLLDPDIFINGPLPPKFQQLIQAGIPLCYEITDQQIPVHGAARIQADLSLLVGEPSSGRWYGGEIIAGPPAFFAGLDREIREPFRIYQAHIDQVCHQGNELFTSAAVEKMIRAGWQVADAGELGLITRFWSVVASRKQKYYQHYAHIFLIHAPADKEFIAFCHQMKMTSPGVFLKTYSLYTFFRRQLSQAKEFFLRLRAGIAPKSK